VGKNSQIPQYHSTVELTEGCSGCEIPIRECWACRHCLRWRRKGVSEVEVIAKFRRPELHLERLAEALRWGPPTAKEQAEKPWMPKDRRYIFVSSRGDAFDRQLPHSWLTNIATPALQEESVQRSVLARIESSPHVYIFCTKQPENMPDIVWPSNVILLVSVTDQKTANWCIPALLLHGRGAMALGVSAEPMREKIDLREYLSNECSRSKPGSQKLGWVIAGQGRGVKGWPYSQEWAAKLQDQCAINGNLFFDKDNERGLRQIPGGEK